MKTAISVVACLLFVGLTAGEASPVFAQNDAPSQVLRAGAAAVDITPQTFPVIVSGSFHEKTADRANDNLHARALVLDDGRQQLALVVIDSLMMTQDYVDRIKTLAQRATGIHTEHMLISATHTHSAPSVMGCLGSGVDQVYLKWLPDRVVQAVSEAQANLTDARVGWAVVQDPVHNHCRRWIFRPDRMPADPFGEHTVRAHMHPGYESPNHIGPAGPADPDLSLLALQTTTGKPLAVLANYAMHYYGSNPVSADFCGRFGDEFAALIGADAPFVGIMSQGTSGDSMWMDYSQPSPPRDLALYTKAVAASAYEAYDTIQYHDWVSLDMAETTLRLRRRVPDEKRLAWAREIAEATGDRLPHGWPEVYAREQLYLHNEPEVDVKLQAARIGDLGITALPNEVYGITGLKLKARSPLQPTFNIELANGAQGYIPPPEQHSLGGYTTWPARTAGLEVEAEPKIVSALLELLEQVSGKEPRNITASPSAYSKAVLASQPVAYWRLDELAGPQATDANGKHHGSYEVGVAFFLPGIASPTATPRGNRAVHFAGGRMNTDVPELGGTYSAELWFWNGLSSDARAVTGYMFSRGVDAAEGAPGDHLGIGGTYRADLTGKLIFFNGNALGDVLVGSTSLDPKTWYHVALVRRQRQIQVYLNGSTLPEIDAPAEPGFDEGVSQLFLGGRNDRLFNWEGKLDEVALYDRALTPEEIADHYRAAQRK